MNRSKRNSKSIDQLNLQAMQKSDSHSLLPPISSQKHDQSQSIYFPNDNNTTNFRSLNNSMVFDNGPLSVKPSKKQTKFRLLEARKELNFLDCSSLTPNTSSLKASSTKLNPKQLIKQSHTNLLKVEDEDEEKDREESQKLMQNMQDSFEFEPEDKKIKSIIGETAVQNYYRMYKKNHKILQENDLFTLSNSSQTAMSIFSEKNNVTPCKIGLLKRYGEEEILNVKNMNYGDKYAQMLSEGLQKNQRVQDISDYYLSGNKITSIGANTLLRTISRKAKVLDLASNQIGKLGCTHIAMALQQRDCRIQHLNIEDNKLGDSSIQKILESLEKNTSIQYLNISKNYLSDKISDHICTILQNCPYLEELYLHWNQFTAETGTKIFTVLVENDMLKVLDFSCNSLGLNGNCSDEIGEFLKDNKIIQHLDLSSNQFNLEQSKHISKMLEKNTSMYGFHFAGNHGYVDNRMFLVINETEDNKDLTGEHVKKRIDGCKALQQNMYRNDRDFELVDCCWICEGWQEKEFVWDGEKSGHENVDPYFIHFNFEDFRACYFGKQQGDKLTYKRMLPPGETTYLFTQGEENHMCAEDHNKKENPFRQKVPDIGIYDGTFKDAELQNINFIHYVKNTAVLEDYKPQVSLLPRQRDPVYVPPKKLKKKAIWSFPISLMAKWRQDTPEIINQCFEFDWNRSKKIEKICGDKRQEECSNIKSFLKSKYNHIKATYKYFASINPAGDIWGIQNVAFWEFMKDISIIDNLVTQDVINLKQVAVQANSEKGNPRDFINATMRYQTMELLVRIANEKYIEKYKLTTKMDEAIQMLWKEHLEPVMGDTSNRFLDAQQKWRVDNYFNEECDYCLKHYKKIVEHVFKRFSKKKVKPGQAPFMCLDELQQIITLADLQMQEHFGTEFGYFAFNFSMMTQINELDNDRIFQMSLVEFFEALARLADKANFEPHPTLQEELGDYEWHYEKRKATKLGWRLEGLILRMLDTCCETSFKYAYPKVEKSFFCRPDDWEDYEH